MSPSGNGFLLDCSTAPAITFFDPTGRALRTYERGKLLFPHGVFRGDDGHSLRLCSYIPLPQGMTTAGDLGELETGRFFLPMGSPTDDDTRKRVLRLLVIPAGGAKVDGDVLDSLILNLGHQDPAVRDKAAQALVLYGSVAFKYLEASLSSPIAEIRLRASKIRDDILTDHAGYATPERNVRLLAALLVYPDAEVATVASQRLKAILPEAAVVAIRNYSSKLARTADWLEEHAEQLVWDSTSAHYLWKE